MVYTDDCGSVCLLRSFTDTVTMTPCPGPTKEKLGLVQVYTGNGKGKTTCALGLALRAIGSGLNVIMVQFLKPDCGYGEQVMAKSLESFEMVSLGADHMCGSKVSREEDLELTGKAMEVSTEALRSGRYDLVILDEINNSMRFGHVSAEDVIAMLECRAPNTEVVLTGRGAPAEIIEYADLVTEMTLVKHPMDRGIPARKGIEF